MHQKDLVRHAWEQAGLYRSRDAKLRKFLAHFDKAGPDCWPELATELRDNYAEYLDTLVQPLWNTGDRLIRVNLLRLARLDDKKERALIESVVGASDPRTDEIELRTLAFRGDLKLTQQIAAKKGLAPALAQFVTRRLDEIKPAAPVRQPRKVVKKKARGASPK